MSSTRRHGRFAVAILSLLLLPAAAWALEESGPARLIKDINPLLSPDMGSNPAQYRNLGEFTLFWAQTEAAGRELWRTDGTEAGTSLVKDVWPGRMGSLTTTRDESAVATLGDTIFIAAEDGVHGRELWRSDGTEAGTLLVRDIFPGFGSAFSTQLSASGVWAHVEVGGLLYFLADDGVHGLELWRSDGTEAGTFLLLDIWPGPGGAFGTGSTPPLRGTGVNGVMLFNADDGVLGTELWKTDGTIAGTVLVQDIHPGPGGSFPRDLFGYGGTLLFAADAAGADTELWASDGTAAGTRLVKDLVPGTSGSSPGQLTEVGGAVYFSSGANLWKTDGTAGGTFKLREFGSNTLRLFGGFNGALIFSARENAFGQELWKSDGTGAGTLMIKDIHPGAASSVTSLPPVELGGSIYFIADDGTHGAELWRSDGTEGGTALVADISPGSTPSRIASIGAGKEVLYVTTSISGGRSLWRTDGTGAGTERLIDLPILDEAVAAGGALLFSTDDGRHGQELWRSDGTKQGTFFLKDINPLVRTRSSSGAVLGVVTAPGAGERALLSADDGGHGSELWATDGTVAGTTLVKDIRPGNLGSEPGRQVVLDGTLYFSASDGSHGRELWKSDGTETGTLLVADINPGPGDPLLSKPIVMNGRLYFTATDSLHGKELWTSDGTEAGTALVADIIPGPAGSVGNLMIEIGGMLYFHADDGLHGFELWKSDGTEAGTELVADINPGPGHACCGTLAKYGGRLFLTARDAVHDVEPWLSDGTAAGTFILKDIYPGGGSSGIFETQELNGFLYFAARDEVHGRELWRSDGTTGGTVLVKDVVPGEMGAVDAGSLTILDGRLYFSAFVQPYTPPVLWVSDGTDAGTMAVTPGFATSPSGLSAVDGALLFTATDAAHGREAWRSDGSGSGTILVQDIAPGLANSSPSNFTLFGRRILFAADDGASGKEFWIARAAVFLGQPERAVRDLADEVVSRRLARGMETSLKVKLDAAAEALAESRVIDAVVALEGFIKHVDVLTPKRIPGEAADGLREFAQEILALLDGAAG